MIDLETIAKEVAIQYGKQANYACIWEVMHKHGLRDNDGVLADRVYEMIQDAEIRIKIRSC